MLPSNGPIREMYCVLWYCLVVAPLFTTASFSITGDWNGALNTTDTLYISNPTTVVVYPPCDISGSIVFLTTFTGASITIDGCRGVQAISFTNPVQKSTFIFRNISTVVT